jgi:hypothetical protein
MPSLMPERTRRNEPAPVTVPEANGDGVASNPLPEEPQAGAPGNVERKNEDTEKDAASAHLFKHLVNMLKPKLNTVNKKKESGNGLVKIKSFTRRSNDYYAHKSDEEIQHQRISAIADFCPEIFPNKNKYFSNIPFSCTDHDKEILEQIHRVFESGADSKEIQLDKQQTEMFEKIMMTIEGASLPRGFKQALKDAHSTDWVEKTFDELDSHATQKTFVPILKSAVPEERRVIGSDIVYDAKADENGDLERRKARLVGKEYARGYDGRILYSPVVEFDSIRLLVAIAVRYNLPIEQCDISTAYLNGILESKVYMRIFDGLIQWANARRPTDTKDIIAAKKQILLQHAKSIETGEQMVLEVSRGIPGFRESGRAWNKALHTTLTNPKKLGFTQIKTDGCVYVRKVNGSIQILAVFVDDIILVGHGIDVLIQKLAKTYKLKSGGRLKWFLSVRYTWLPNGSVRMDQTQFVEKILERFHMAEMNTYRTPMDDKVIFSRSDCPPLDQKLNLPYAELVYAMLYIARWTRPDIALPIAILCRFASNPAKKHWKAALRVLGYLKGTKHEGITFSPHTENSGLYGFADAEFATIDPDTRKSFGGQVLMYAGGPISWKVKQHARPAGSTSVSEYYTLSTAAEDVKAVSQLLAELGLPEPEGIPIFEDNSITRMIANRECKEKRLKSVDIKHHIVKDLVATKVIRVLECPTRMMVADILTKSFGYPRFLYLSNFIMGGTKNLDLLVTELLRIGGT